MVYERILVVDDHPINLKLADLLLTGEGYEVRTCGTAEEALAAVEEFRPRLILMDVQLPGMDGLEATRVLKRDPAHRHIVVIALTAHAMKGDEEKVLSAGCDGYVSKPINVDALALMVAEKLSSLSAASG